ncbi:MAG TPA: peroxiredoxin [Terriglobales bacterium]|jgi:peroxiredoxin Q/BCP
MRLWMWIALAVLVIGVGAVATKNAFAADPPAVGAQAPEFTLPTQEGNPVSLKDFHGKWVVLYFYPKDMTTGCTIEAHNFQRDQEQYTKRNAVVLGVSVDTPDSHKQFCTKEGLTFKLLADPEKKVTSAYGSLKNYGVAELAARNTFIIDPSGKIVKVYTGVEPNKHSEEVIAALDGLNKGM